ncbi:hypothetical protein [Nocardia brasiliensis]|uniref:hypothetical protein n=1 Tax=Nocardia brasiliensis TaxID=37326 RepID=UPI001894F383|nr:hypothetical protein [Nocardia brasiliensis]MBF6125555.1 hypothetical protein [Nocardia brasiliensis]
MPDTRTPNNAPVEHGAGWLRTAGTAVHPVSPMATGSELMPGSELHWIPEPGAQGAGSEPPTGSRRRWLWAGVATVLMASVVGMGFALVPDHSNRREAIPPSQTAAPQSSATVANAHACTGLSGATVSDGAGDTRSPAGVIVAFEHAYYVRRDAGAALALVAAEAGLIAEALAAGIASIPAGTAHCVALTPLADSTAVEVHLVERHPDGTRTDYLQLINIRTDEHGSVITNIQKRG